MKRLAPLFPIGTTFTPRGRKHPHVCTVVDMHVTTNIAGELVKVRYVATHEFMGQLVFDYEVLATTIAMGNPEAPK